MKIVVEGDEGRIELDGGKEYTVVSVFVGPEDDMCMTEVATPDLLQGITELSNGIRGKKITEGKSGRTEKQLYDAAENLLCELYADGPTQRGEDRVSRCLLAFEKKYGDRQNGKWRDKPK